MFEKLGKFIVKARYYIMGLFLILLICSCILIPQVLINYDISEYLPDSSETKIAINLMEDEFGSIGTAEVMLTSVTKSDAKIAVSIIASIDGVASVVFDENQTTYYNDESNMALIQVFLSSGDYEQETATTLENIETQLNDYDFSLVGSSVEAITNRSAIEKEMTIILIVAILIVIAILFLTSRAYIEPLIFIIVIGVAILINMGTNLIFGEISFITKSISSIMLIALAMDYSIVLLHRYREEREKTNDSHLAMAKAISGSLVAVLASSLTVMAGLISLVFMDFLIGYDIGMVLTKGVLISVICVIFLMPSIILLLDKSITKPLIKVFCLV